MRHKPHKISNAYVMKTTTNFLLILLCGILLSSCKKEDPATTGTLQFYIQYEQYDMDLGVNEYGPISGATVALSNTLAEAQSEVYYQTINTTSNGEVSFPSVTHGTVYYTVKVDNLNADYGLVTTTNFTATSVKITETVPYE